ncbi:Kelch repeat-containing protein [Pyxidicoccus xibeiensis]|uniref:Kelch repeat-containing protein n=1 Tax=Pyxidicoccus xibeiensis TaxID=2906759 RepID=UPI0020A7FB6E|nr:kelch repeat-containing protein [Pyxidicoccus xibeiensis]MCP3145183.1 hypothetical protein [Pyxidicoccus xibeiensis]
MKRPAEATTAPMPEPTQDVPHEPDAYAMCRPAPPGEQRLSLKEMAKLLADNGFTPEDSARALRGAYPDTTAGQMSDALVAAWPGLTPERLAAALKAAGYDTRPTWMALASMPTPRSMLGVGVVEGRLLAIAGQSTRPSSGNEAYDPATNTWTRLAPMPAVHGARNLAVGVVGGKLHALGGDDAQRGANPLTLHFAYDAATDTWAARRELPIATQGHGLGVVGGKLHVVGGMSRSVRFTSANLEYDAAGDSWRQRAPMPTARDGLAVGVVGGLLHAIGGRSSQSPFSPLAVHEVYDPVTDTWSSRKPMPTPRSYLAMAVVGGKLYAIGGGVWHDTGRRLLDTVEVYDSATDTWSSLPPLPSARYFHSAASIGDTLYAVGGEHDAPTSLSLLEALRLS